MKVWPSDPKSQLRKSESHEDGSGGGEPEGDQQPGQGEVHAFLHTACAGAGGEGSDEGGCQGGQDPWVTSCVVRAPAPI